MWKFCSGVLVVMTAVMLLSACGGSKTEKKYFDDTPPTIARAYFTDTDSSQTVTAGDVITVVFTEAITLNSATDTSFRTYCTGDSLTGAAVAASGTDAVTITLVAGNVVTVDGTFDPSAGTWAAGSPSGIDVSATCVITDTYGNPAVTTPVGGAISGVDIEGSIADLEAPELLSCLFVDNGDRGVGNGDYITLTFSENVQLVTSPSAVSDSDFTIPVTSDTLGTDAFLADGTTGDAEIELYLGTSPTLTIVGVFSNSVTTAGSPSGLGIIDWSGLVQDTSAQANDAVASGPFDIQAGSFTPDNTGPSLTAAVFVDNNSNGHMEAGDFIALTFSENVLVDGGCTSAIAVTTANGSGADFDLPVTSDSAGSGAAIILYNSNTINLILGTSPVLLVNGTYDGTTTAGSPSGINIGDSIDAGLITDDSLQANEVLVLGNAIDIQGDFVEDTTGPNLVSVLFVDVNNDRALGNGDKLTLTFDETVQIAGGTDNVAITDSELYWPTSGSDTIGSTDALLVDATKGDAILEIYIQNDDAAFTVTGTYDTADPTAGPSGFGIQCSSIITDTSYYLNELVAISAADNALDIDGTFVEDLTGPKLLSAYFDNSDNTLTLLFDEDVVIPSGNTNLAKGTEYELPVTGDNLGDISGADGVLTAHATDSRKAVIYCGSDYNLTTEGAYNGSLLGAGNASGIYIVDMTGVVTDDSGNLNPAVGTIDNAVDIIGKYVEQDLLDNAADMSAARAYHTATTLDNGAVVVIGGFIQRLDNGTLEQEYLASAEMYDPVTDGWSALGNMSTVRAYHSAILLPDGKVGVFEGYTGTTYLGSVEILDPATGQFELLNTSYYYTNTVGPAYLIETGNSVLLAGTGLYEYFDIPTLTVESGVIMFGSYQHRYSASAQFEDGTVAIFGGQLTTLGCTNWATCNNIFYMGDRTGVIDNNSNLNTYTRQMGATSLKNGKILAFGGIRYDTGLTLNSSYICTDTGVLTADLANSGEMNVRRHSAIGWPLGTGKALIMGGNTDNGAYYLPCQAIEIFDPEADSGTGAFTNSSNTMYWPAGGYRLAAIPGPDGILDTEDDFVLITGGVEIIEGSSNDVSRPKVFIYKP